MSKSRPPIALALVGLGIAYAAFAVTFGGRRERFWQRMTATGAVLATLALASDRDLRRTRIGTRDVILGLWIAAGLYGIFRVGDRAARAVLPAGDREIASIYELRELRPREEIATRLATVIGPAEELFWRGLVQRALAARLGGATAALAATAAYGGAHLASGNTSLIGAASVAGLYWSALAALGAPMGALIVSHVVWDIWIFLVAPTERPSNASGSDSAAGS